MRSQGQKRPLTGAVYGIFNGLSATHEGGDNLGGISIGPNTISNTHFEAEPVVGDEKVRVVSSITVKAKKWSQREPDVSECFDMEGRNGTVYNETQAERNTIRI